MRRITESAQLIFTEVRGVFHADFLRNRRQAINAQSSHRLMRRLHGTGIERLFAIANAEKSGGLLECFCSETRYTLQFSARLERTFFVAVGHNVFGQSCAAIRCPSFPQPGVKPSFFMAGSSATLLAV